MSLAALATVQFCQACEYITYISSASIAYQSSDYNECRLAL